MPSSRNIYGTSRKRKIMPSDKNVQAVALLKTEFAQSKSVILADYSGLSVADQVDLRAKVAEAGGTFSVAKNNLIKLALGETVGDTINEALNGPTAVLIAKEDAVTALKAMVTFAKEKELPKIKAGFMDGKSLTLEEVVELAKLPGRSELMARLIGTINAPRANMVYVLKANLSGLVRVLKAVGEKGSN